MSEEHIDRRLAAILVGDVAGYSRLMGANSDSWSGPLPFNATGCNET
jgi:hypothetical protein